MSIIQIPPHHYIHVLDQNTNIAHMEIGPLTYVLQDNERVLFSPERMIMVPPRQYCVIANPVVRDDNGQVLFDQSGQAKLRHGDLDIRLTQDPFPLYPGEEIQQDVTPLQIKPDTALRLQAVQDFEDDGGVKRVAGDEWLFEGPETYIPRKEVLVIEVRNGGDKVTTRRVAGTVAGAVVGAVGAVAAAPLVLGALGFTSTAGGIAALSGLVAALESAGMAGLLGALSPLVGGAGAAAGGATASAVAGGAGAAVGGVVGGSAVGWMNKLFGKKNQND